MSHLFSPATLGPFIQNHLVMSPLTRNRAIDNVPNDLMAPVLRAAGLGGTDRHGRYVALGEWAGLSAHTGNFSAAQVAGWKRITDAVHARGAKMFVQLMHCGRIAHPLNLPAGAASWLLPPWRPPAKCTPTPRA